MSQVISSEDGSSQIASQIAFVGAGLVLVFLGALHFLSPEFDPAWRMVSEYALGRHGLLLSLMFVSWAISTWALAFAIRPHLRGVTGHIGVLFLFAAGLGEAMASLFDVKHALHGTAAMIGIPSLPIAAMLISFSLTRTEAWRSARAAVLWAANLTWISFVLMAAAMAIFIFTYQRAGGQMSAGTEITSLPVGVITLHGWANRLLIVAYCLWTMTVARIAAKMH